MNLNDIKKNKFKLEGNYKLELIQRCSIVFLISENIFIATRFQELRRDLQTVIKTRTNFNIMHIENYGGETFLSENVATSLLQEFNHSLDRCLTVFNIKFILFNFFKNIKMYFTSVIYLF